MAKKLSAFEKAFAEARAQGKGTKFKYGDNEFAAYYAGEEPESWRKGKAKSAEVTPARQMSVDEFMSNIERGQMESPSSAMSSSRGPSTRGGRRATPEEMEATNERIRNIRASEAMKRNRGFLPSDRATNFRTQAEETGMTPEERAEKAREYSTNIAMTAGAGRLGAMAGAPYRLTSGAFRKTADEAAEAVGRRLASRGIPAPWERYAAGEAAAAQRAKYKKIQQMKDFAEEMEAKMRLSRGSVYRKGGSVKKYAKGGSISPASKRADGIASKGKTKGRFV